MSDRGPLTELQGRTSAESPPLIGRRRSLLPPLERLGSTPDGVLIHAAYPSAQRTLCLLRTDGAEPGGPVPTCLVCVETARVWDRVDGSAPDRWGWDT
jgi:hypothetical protein